MQKSKILPLSSEDERIWQKNNNNSIRNNLFSLIRQNKIRKLNTNSDHTMDEYVDNFYARYNHTKIFPHFLNLLTTIKKGCLLMVVLS